MEAEEKVCIDTDVLTDLKLRKGRALQIVQEMERKGTLLATTDINAFELYYGAYKSAKMKENLLEAKKTLSTLRRLPTDDISAEVSADVLVELERKGLQIDVRDLLVGCIALARDHSILTGNINHFKRISGLRVVPYK